MTGETPFLLAHRSTGGRRRVRVAPKPGSEGTAMRSTAELADIIHHFRVGREEAHTLAALGDGVYATFDGDCVWLRAFNGHRVHDCIALDPSALRQLIRYAVAKQVLRAAESATA